MKQFSFKLEATQNKARAGHFMTAHGVVKTPIFMPVGTQATVKALDSSDITQTGAQIILANTYHLHLRPGEKLISKLGGVHQFMNWSGPILTDSGGFQVLSLGESSQIQADGVKFYSHLDGSEHFFTPEVSVEIQRQLGADIIMAFDECTPDQSTAAYAREAVDRTHRWAQQSLDYWLKKKRQSAQGHYQALFGIIQGAMHQPLRLESTQVITDMDFDGMAVGGETVGFNMKGTVELMGWIEHLLPTNKPRYAMGLGRDPQDVIDAVMVGFDMFDCVGPTRLARNGALFHGQLKKTKRGWVFDSEYQNARLNIGNSRYKSDNQVLLVDCDCTTCRGGYTRAYLNHLYKAQELLYHRLATAHNVRIMIKLCEDLRSQIIGQ